MKFLSRLRWYHGVIILLVGVIVITGGAIIAHLNDDVKNAQAQSASDQLSKDIARYSADPNLEVRNAHPVHSVFGLNSVIVEAPLELGGFQASRISYFLNTESIATQVVVMVSVPEDIYKKAVADLRAQGIEVGTKNIALSERAAGALVNLHEVYAHIFALTHGVNPFAIDYQLVPIG